MNNSYKFSRKIKSVSEEITDTINSLKKAYPFIDVGEIGISVLGKPIKYIKVGEGKKEVVYFASFHANEWITTYLLIKFLKAYLMAYDANKDIFKYNARSLYQNTSLYIVPMVNPDGVDLVTGGIQNVDKAYQEVKKISEKYPNIPFPNGWKANINGVDLNLQFPAGWENAKKIKRGQGYTGPAPRDYVGINPLSEPEAIAVYNFTLRHNFELAITYHTQGKEIYWNFQNINPPNGKLIGEKFSKLSGYKLAYVPYNSSFAGYKDWFVQKYNKPAYTIEAGIGNNPLPFNQLEEIYADNIGILELAITKLDCRIMT